MNINRFIGFGGLAAVLLVSVLACSFMLADDVSADSEETEYTVYYEVISADGSVSSSGTVTFTSAADNTAYGEAATAAFAAKEMTVTFSSSMFASYNGSANVGSYYWDGDSWESIADASTEYIGNQTVALIFGAYVSGDVYTAISDADLKATYTSTGMGGEYAYIKSPAASVYTLTVTYDVGDHGSAVANTTAQGITGQTVTVSLGEVTPAEGYTFNGWSTTEGGSVLADNQYEWTVTSDKALTLYAIYTEAAAEDEDEDETETETTTEKSWSDKIIDGIIDFFSPNNKTGDTSEKNTELGEVIAICVIIGILSIIGFAIFHRPIFIVVGAGLLIIAAVFWGV